MRRILATFAAIGVLAVPAQAQDFTADAEFQGSGPPVNTPFFQWEVTGSTLPGFGGQVDMLCIDERHYVSVGQDLTPGAFFDINTVPTDILTGLSYNTAALNTVAEYYDFLALNIGSMSNSLRKSAQVAIWQTMNTWTGVAHGSTTRAAFDAYYASAQLNGYTRPSGYEYYVMLEESDLANIRNGNLNGVTQPQLARVAIPEPAAAFLFASALLGIGLVGIRRRAFEA